MYSQLCSFCLFFEKTLVSNFHLGSIFSWARILPTTRVFDILSGNPLYMIKTLYYASILPLYSTIFLGVFTLFGHGGTADILKQTNILELSLKRGCCVMYCNVVRVL